MKTYLIEARKEPKANKVDIYVLIISWLMILYFTLRHGSAEMKVKTGELLALL